MRRSEQRRDAVFVSYQRDVTGRPLEELVADSRPLTREIAEGVDYYREELDDEIEAHAKGWAVERLAPLDLNVMRVALYEIEHTRGLRHSGPTAKSTRPVRSWVNPSAPVTLCRRTSIFGCARRNSSTYFGNT